MKTVGVSRLAIMIAVAGTIFASSASGCVVHERTVRVGPYPPVVNVTPYPYPVIVHRHPRHHWHAGPRRWFHGCDKRGRDCGPRYEADRRGRGHDHHHRGRFRDFDG